MTIVRLLCLSLICGLCFSLTVNATTTYVSSQEEFDTAHDMAEMNDSIVWISGRYSGIYMDIAKSNLNVLSETLGSTVFTGDSRVNISGDYVTLKGFQFLDGNIGTKDVINTTGSNILITQINIRAYRSYKYLRVREASRYVYITYCNFENRLNLDDQNILSILVDENNPGYHKIQYCSFKNFDGTGNDLGIEPIRIGLSTQANRISRTLVEYCYFTQCNGDGEIISSKATQNVYRFNTFENNPKAELVLRHGSRAIVYGNFFLYGKGGVRVREGGNHYIYNNYFFEIDDRAIFLQNESSDPLSSINIAFNTIINSAEVDLGGEGSDQPTDVIFSNNIFIEPKDQIFKDATGTEMWIGNIASGTLGIPEPSNGISTSPIGLDENSKGYFGLPEGSPAINAALPGYKSLPQFAGMDDIDTDIRFDIMGQDRPSNIAQKDLGCSEYPQDILIEPIATEENTGPSYNTSVFTAVKEPVLIVDDLMELTPNPVAHQLKIKIFSESNVDLKIEVFNYEGRKMYTIANESDFQGTDSVLKNIDDLPSGSYTLRATTRSGRSGVRKMQIIQFIKAL